MAQYSLLIGLDGSILPIGLMNKYSDLISQMNKYSLLIGPLNKYEYSLLIGHMNKYSLLICQKNKYFPVRFSLILHSDW